MSKEIQTFYDSFSTRSVDDYIYGNERVQRQLQLFSRAIRYSAQRVLIVGCGTGQGAQFIATRVAKEARVLAVDLSPEAVSLANSLFYNERIEYRQLDVLKAKLEGEWDVIVLPDVYEHIPLEERKGLHSKLNDLLAKNGMLVLTVPSPGYQEYLSTKGTGLQPVDEIVTLADLMALADEVGGTLTYFCMISVWLTNDYIHAVIERGAERVMTISHEDEIPVKGLPRRSIRKRGRDFLFYRLRFEQMSTFWRQWHARRTLRNL